MEERHRRGRGPETSRCRTGIEDQRLGGTNREVNATPRGDRRGLSRALSLTGTPVFAQSQTPAQRGGPPGADTPYILVTTFQSSDRQLGVEAADEVRKRIQGEHAAKELYVIPKTSINNTLDGVGLPSGLGAQRVGPDGAVQAAPRRIRARRHGRREAGGGVHVESRMLMRTGTSDAHAAAARPSTARTPATSRRASIARLAMRSRACRRTSSASNDLRAPKYDQAAKDAARRHRGVPELVAQPAVPALRRTAIRRRRPTRSSARRTPFWRSTRRA